MMVKAVHEHRVQQITFCTAARVLQHHEMAMVRGHRESELGHCCAAIGQQALAERGVCPGPGDDTGAVLRQPFLKRQVTQFADGLGRLQPVRIERRLDCVDALLHGRCPRYGIAIGNAHCG